MTFDEWASEYFGKNVDVPEACRDAWEAATKAEREACAKVCRELNYFNNENWTAGTLDCEKAIRNRGK